MPYIDHLEGKVFYTVDGTGPTHLVFLHGFLGNLSVWDRYIDNLSSDYTIVRMDLPGHGDSDSIASVHSMELMAAQVLLAIDSLNIIQAHLVGHSMGGYVAMAFAELHPERTLSITLFNSTTIDDSEQKKRDRIRTIRVIELSPELFVSEAINNLFTSENLLKHKEEVARLKQIGVNTGLNGAAPALRGMAERSDMLGKLNQLQIPVLFIAGRFDNIIPIESVIDQVNQLNASLVILEKSSHMGFVEEYELTLSTLVKFWNSVKVLT